MFLDQGEIQLKLSVCFSPLQGGLLTPYTQQTFLTLGAYLKLANIQPKSLHPENPPNVMKGVCQEDLLIFNKRLQILMPY